MENPLSIPSNTVFQLTNTFSIKLFEIFNADDRQLVSAFQLEYKNYENIEIFQSLKLEKN